MACGTYSNSKTMLRIATESEWVFAMIEHNLYFKSSVIEKTLIKSLTFQHLRKLFVEHFQFPI